MLRQDIKAALFRHDAIDFIVRDARFCREAFQILKPVGGNKQGAAGFFNRWLDRPILCSRLEILSVRRPVRPGLLLPSRCQGPARTLPRRNPAARTPSDLRLCGVIRFERTMMEPDSNIHRLFSRDVGKPFGLRARIDKDDTHPVSTVRCKFPSWRRCHMTRPRHAFFRF